MTEALSPDAAPPRPFRKSRRADERVRIMGWDMDMIRPEEVWLFVARKIAAREQAIIANHNLNSLYLAKKNAELRAFYDIADLIEVDSVPILLWAKLTGRKGRRFHRCTYLDWRDSFWETARTRGWRVFYLGGAPGVAAEAAKRLGAEFPRIEIGVRDGYFDMAVGSDDATQVAKEINAFGPDILFVGMGMPRQEAWIVRNHAGMPPCAIFSVGAAFDYEAGVQKAAPRWMGRVGLEWAFRLVVDPGRLFRRYCVEPWGLIAPALGDLAAAAFAPKTPERRAADDRRNPRPRDPAKPGRRGADHRGLGTPNGD